MSYTLQKYVSGSATLFFTLLDGRYDIGNGDSPAPTTPLASGEFDELGPERAPRRAQTVRVDEWYVGSDRAAKIRAWKAVHRTKGQLWRIDDDTSLPQWTTARLRAIPIQRTVENAMEQDISLSFLLYDPVWSGAQHGGLVQRWGLVASGGTGTTYGSGHTWNETAGDVFALNSSSSTVVALTNDGNTTVYNAILTFVIGDAAVTSIRVQQATLGIDFTWTGTAPSLSLFVLDMGKQTITNDGTPAYSGYVRNVGYTVDTPMAAPIPPGSTNYTITLVGGGSVVTTTLRADYFDGYE